MADDDDERARDALLHGLFGAPIAKTRALCERVVNAGPEEAGDALFRDAEAWLNADRNVQWATEAGRLDRVELFAHNRGRLTEKLIVTHGIEAFGKSKAELAEKGRRTTKPRGETEKTRKRKEFLRKVAAKGDGWTAEALANEAVNKHPRKVARLWGKPAADQERKVLRFLKNLRQFSSPE